jgi:hypothetical protein
VTLWTNNLNGITSGATVTTANSGGTSGTAFNPAVVPTGGSLTAATAAAFEGTNGLQIVFPSGSSPAGYVAWATSVAVGNRVAGSFWYKYGAAPSALEPIMTLGGHATVRLTTSGQLAFHNSGGTAIATATAATAGTWVYVQWATTSSATSGAGRYEFRVTKADGTSLLSYDSGATLTLSSIFGTYYVGRPSGVAIAQTNSYDLIALDTALTSGFPGDPAPAVAYASGQFFPFL